ncbi:MAG TPA: SDR family NAD(P)-dependent oxidoreductase, partial [Bdellovibrio sp.]
MKSALVTGAAGFLGSHLCEALVADGFFVIGIDNCSTGFVKNIEHLIAKNDKFIFINADVTAPWNSWLTQVSEKHLQNVQYIFHFASAASPVHYKRLSLETLWANSVGLGYALDFARGKSARVVFASTSEVYGDPQVHPQPETYWGHVNSFGERSCYDEAKRFGEALIYSFNLRHQSRHGVVRIFNTYGPRMSPQDGRVIISFLKSAQENKPLVVSGDGKQTRTFCYVSDLIAGVIAYAKSDVSEPLNLGGTEEISIIETAQKVQSIFGSKASIEFSKLPEDDPQKRKPDLTKAL